MYIDIVSHKQSCPQLHHLVYIMKAVGSTPGLGNKLSVLLKGPGWAPGKPRLGLNSDIPPVSQTHKVDLW